MRSRVTVFYKIPPSPPYKRGEQIKVPLSKGDLGGSLFQGDRKLLQNYVTPHYW
jgi:hypothetical protein